MGDRLTVARLYVPQRIRKQRLEIMLEATAQAFEVSVPTTTCLDANGCLKLYADFTRAMAEESLRSGDEGEVQPRLFENARRLGEELRTEFRVKSTADVMRLSRVVYRLIGIDFRGEADGEIIIRRCFFSGYYSGPVCRLVSSLDAGLLSGLAGGGKLTFSKRITEGNECCRANLDLGTGAA